MAGTSPVTRASQWSRGDAICQRWLPTACYVGIDTRSSLGRLRVLIVVLFWAEVEDELKPSSWTFVYCPSVVRGKRGIKLIPPHRKMDRLQCFDFDRSASFVLDKPKSPLTHFRPRWPPGSSTSKKRTNTRSSTLTRGSHLHETQLDSAES